MSMPQFKVEFTKQGKAFNANQVQQVLDNLGDVTDLFVISHGWNNNTAEADSLYDRLFQSIDEILGADVVAGLEDRRFAAVRVFWPSKKFDDAQLIPGGGAASATAENDQALVDLLESMKLDPERLGGTEVNSDWAAELDRAQSLIPRLETDEAARAEFVECLRGTLDQGEAHTDDGSQEFFTRDASDLFDRFGTTVTAPVPAGAGGATAVGGGEGAAGLGDLLSGIKAAARRIANYATYYRMKARAGLVGRTGVQQLIRQIRQRKPDVKIHLIGHSFGGRLVTAAADALDPSTPSVSVTLLQAAFSHNGLAKDFDGSHDGLFRKLVAEKRASGPILITHTKNDRAVGVAYPLASRVANQQASALGDENDPYGGMGRNGAQHTPEATNVPGGLKDVGEAYAFALGKVFNLKADRFIKGHSDVTGHQVAYAILHGVAAV